jgi:hypothetical protein
MGVSRGREEHKTESLVNGKRAASPRDVLTNRQNASLPHHTVHGHMGTKSHAVTLPRDTPS